MKFVSAISHALAALMAAACCGCDDSIVVVADSTPQPSTTGKPTLNVYIENSGSMDGYMCDGSQLKDAVYDYVSDLSRHCANVNLHYINSKPIAFKGTLEQYIKALNPAAFQRAGGNRANSDLSQMVDSVVAAVNDTTVAIFVSDCILDLPVSNSRNFLNTCRIAIRNSVGKGRERVEGLGVEVLKLSSNFSGKYFYPDGKYEQLDGVERPYYIWVFGDCGHLAALNKRVPLREKFAGDSYSLKGIVAFAGERQAAYDVGNSKLTGNVVRQTSGAYKLLVRADLSTTLQPEEAVMDPANYSFSGANLLVADIRRITAPDGAFTHYVAVEIPAGVRVAQARLTFCAPPLPEWVEASNDDSGTDVSSNLDKTTGIKHLIGGVADAYGNRRPLTNFQFTIKNQRR